MGLQKIQNKFILLAIAFLFMGMAVVPTSKVAAQACTTTTNPATTYGQVTQTVNVATAGTYKVWSRIKASSTSDNSYYFQINNGCAINVGDSQSIPANSWTWVNYQNGNTGSAVTVNLTAGTHTVKFTGKEADVQVDRVLLLTSNCSPTGTGDDCATSDSNSPTISIGSPASGTTVAPGSSVDITANASDNTGITKVEFYVDGSLKNTDSSTPYSYSWNTTGLAAGAHSLTARAYDTSGNTATSPPVTVNIQDNNDGNDGNTITLTPSADASLYQSSASTNYGSATSLEVDNSPVKDFLMKFDVSGTSGKTIESAKLRMYAVNGSDSGGVVYKTGTSWSEGSVNWGNAPAPAEKLGTIGATSIGSWYEIDVTSLVTGDGPVAVRLKSTSSNGSDYSSKEAATNKPTLVITTSGGQTGDTVKPTASVSVAKPVVTPGGSQTVNAQASDNVAVTKVEFWLDGKVWNTDTTAPYTYTWNTSKTNTGQKVMMAKAYDAAGNIGESATVTYTVGEGGSSPTPVPGDANGDGRVNGIDYSILATHDGSNHAPADFNKDGVVGAADLAILLSRWTW